MKMTILDYRFIKKIYLSMTITEMLSIKDRRESKKKPLPKCLIN